MPTPIWPLENGQRTSNKKHPLNFALFRQFLRFLSRFCTFGPSVCERGGALQKCKTPNPRKVLGRVLQEVPARSRALG